MDHRHNNSFIVSNIPSSSNLADFDKARKRFGCGYRPVDALNNDENLSPRSTADWSTIQDGIVKLSL